MRFHGGVGARNGGVQLVPARSRMAIVDAERPGHPIDELPLPCWWTLKVEGGRRAKAVAVAEPLLLRHLQPRFPFAVRVGERLDDAREGQSVDLPRAPAPDVMLVGPDV